VLEETELFEDDMSAQFAFAAKAIQAKDAHGVKRKASSFVSHASSAAATPKVMSHAEAAAELARRAAAASSRSISSNGRCLRSAERRRHLPAPAWEPPSPVLGTLATPPHELVMV
jgi:hypothetical protein